MKKFLSLGLCLLLYACVERVDTAYSLRTDLLVVSGIITDRDQPQTIRLSRSRSRSDSMSVDSPVTQARVEVVVDSTERLPLTEIEPGLYRMPVGFRGRIGHVYQLRFRTAEGVGYESSAERLNPVPPIGRVYSQFNPAGPKRTADGLPVPANEVFLDFDDPAGVRNFYFWRWRLYEIQGWCATCEQGRYKVRDVGPLGAGPIEVLGCVRDTSLNTYNVFDYPCRDLCWDIFYGQNLVIASDVFSNGQRQLGQKIASVPIYQLDPALIVVEQLSLSLNAWRYYKLLTDQAQNSGTLADSPPAPIAGNVRNLTDPNENVIGYFSAAAVAVRTHKLIRRDTPAATSLFQGLFKALNGRFPVAEQGRNIPSALCVPGRSRTNQLPPGWND
jgi:hypothetical protein